MIDPSTSYMGLKLRTPLVSSASPLTRELDSVRRLEDAGASALVLYSVFEESPPARSALESYLSHIRKTKEAVSVPLVASVGALTARGWTDYAKQIEQAGVEAIELNLYQVPSQLDISGAEIEKDYVETLKTVKSAVRVPVAAKLTPFFTSMANMAKRFDEAGANALVLFNRFYQPDINLEELEVQPNVLLSTPQAMRLPLTWIGILYGRVRANLAGSGGVHGAEDVVKLLLAGADVTLMCSALLQNGIRHLHEVERGLQNWMEQHEYGSVAQLRGILSQLRCSDPAAFERAQYINAVKGVEKVVATGREAWRILSGC
jgi:dihydroorotate dehydrogenase (fumarate)